MTWLLCFIFFSSGYFILHTYVVYPSWMWFRARKHKDFVSNGTSLPKVAVLVAAYNEEAVIEEKLISTINTSYPLHLLQVFIGSDCSSDRTDDIVRSFAARHPQVFLRRFESRTGKPQIINQLIKQADADIIVMSDADTFFLNHTITNLVIPFEDEKTGGVQARFRSWVSEKQDVAKQELKYNNREVLIKRGQSVDGAVIGAYGACYALRKQLYEPVPEGFLVDDFYIFMKILEKGFKTVLAENALCHLEVSGESKTEFKRKVRIGTGNYQNFFRLSAFWNPFASRASFYYWSHKVLRWFTPFFLLMLLVSNVLLAAHSHVFLWMLYLQLSGYFLVLADTGLKAAGVHTGPLRFVSHFVMMNLALLVGFFRFLKKQKVSSW